jgi:hypothetical protein
VVCSWRVGLVCVRMTAPPRSCCSCFSLAPHCFFLFSGSVPLVSFFFDSPVRADVAQLLPLLEQQRNQQQKLLAGIEGLAVRMDGADVRMEQTERIQSVTAGVFNRRYRFSQGKASAPSRNVDFKKSLLAEYGLHSGVCQLLGAGFEERVIRGAHLFKHAWNDVEDLKLLDLDSIDNVRNGLLLFQPIEAAFDDSRLCFLPAGSTFSVHIIDPTLRDKRLVDRLEKRLPKKSLPPGAFQTFGALEGRCLQFSTALRPFARVLCFHSRQALSRARDENWNPDPVDPSLLDNWSDGDYKQTVVAWFAGNDRIAAADSSDSIDPSSSSSPSDGRQDSGGGAAPAAQGESLLSPSVPLTAAALSSASLLPSPAAVQNDGGRRSRRRRGWRHRGRSSGNGRDPQ